MITPSYTLVERLKALSSLTAHELHDILAPSLPAVGNLPTIAGQLLQLIVPQSRWDDETKSPAHPASGQLKNQKKKQTVDESQLAMPLEDARTDPSTQKIRKAKTTLANLPFVGGKPTQPQREFLALLFGSANKDEIETICSRERIPSPWQVPPAQLGLAAIGVVAALAPPACPGRKTRRAMDLVHELRQSLSRRARHRSQIGVPCEPLWGSEPASASQPNQLTLAI